MGMDPPPPLSSPPQYLSWPHERVISIVSSRLYHLSCIPPTSAAHMIGMGLKASPPPPTYTHIISTSVSSTMYCVVDSLCGATMYCVFDSLCGTTMHCVVDSLCSATMHCVVDSLCGVLWVFAVTFRATHIALHILLYNTYCSTCVAPWCAVATFHMYMCCNV